MNGRLIILAALAIAPSFACGAEPKAPVGPSAAAPTSPAPATVAPVTPSPAPANAAPAPVAPAARSTSYVAPSAPFETFRQIVDRNIFNPNRVARRERTTEEAPAPRLETIMLVGTMDSDKGLRAFFDGSNSSYRKALSAGGSVENFKVTKVAPNLVDLDREGKTLSVRVGQQLRRTNGGEWALVGEEVVRGEAQAAAASRVDPSAPTPIPSNLSEIEKRMRERRNNSTK